MSDLKVATWNLYQFAEPGTYWYEREETNDYEPGQWADKQAWMADMIAQLDADIIGFQEVFSVEAFKTFMTAQGYPHVAVVDDAAIDPDDPAVFVGPVTGIASRHPFAAPPAPLAYPQDMRDGTQLQDDFDFRRAIVRAEVITPQLGAVTVYVCHFKSQGARVDGDEIAALPDWRARFREHLRVRAIKDADQMARRNGEAAGVYLAAMEELDGDINKAIIVLGDLNEDPASPTLRLITQSDRIVNIGRRQRNRIEDPDDRAWNFRWRLFDAYGLRSTQDGAARPPTHGASFWHPASTLDYVLVSNALNQNNPTGIADVTGFDVFSNHFEDDDRLRTTDHAPVRVTLTPRAVT